MTNITLFAHVRNENVNNEFAFRVRDNKHVNLKDFFFALSKKLTLVFGNLLVETERGGVDEQFYLKVPVNCILNSRLIERMSQKTLVKYLGLSAGAEIRFEICNIHNEHYLLAVDFELSNYLSTVGGKIASEHVDGKVYREIMSRRGQFAFRQKLLSRYNSKCAISGCETIEVLEAAHIIPHSENPSYDIGNGIILRADIHTLFDMYLLSINPDTKKVEVSNRCCRQYAGFGGIKVDIMPEKFSLYKHYQRFCELNS